MLPFIAVLVLLQTTTASIAGTTLQNVPSTSRENLQRSLKPSNVVGESSKMAIDKDELARVAKFKRLGMEIGTLDEFLISTTQRNGNKEGYFVFPPVIDFGDENEPEESKKPASGSFYAPSFEKRKPTAETVPVPVEESKPVPEGEIPDGWNWTPGPGEKWTGPLTPAPTKDKPPKPEDNSGEPKRNASKPEVTSGDPDFAFPVNLADRFGAEDHSGNVPNGNVSVSKPEGPSGAPPSYLPVETSQGTPPPPSHPEDDFVKPEVTSKVPDLNYKPSRPPFWPSSGTPPPPKQDEEVPHSSTEKGVTKVPDLNYKPTRPSYLPSLSTSPPKQEEEVPHSSTEASKVPDLNYKPTRPFYYPTSSTLKPPKLEEEVLQSSTDKGVLSTEKEASKVPDLNYKPIRPAYLPTLSTSPPKHEEEVSHLSTEASKVPDLNYKPTRPSFLPTLSTSPPKHEKEVLQSSTEKETSKVPDLNYKPTRPFYYPTLATSPPKHEEEVLHSSTEASKVPDLSYKPMRPFYAGNYPYSTKFPPQKPPVVTHLEDTTPKMPDSHGGPFWTSKPLYESNFPHGSISTRPPTTYKVPQLGYKPMRPFYAGNWNGYPLPTTKGPSFEKKVQDGDLRVDSVHLVKIQFKNGSEEEKVTEDTLNEANTSKPSKPEVSTQKDTLLTKLDKVVDSVKNLGKTVRNFRQEVTSINFSKIKDAVASLFKL